MIGLWRQSQNEAGLPDSVNSLFSFCCHNDFWSGPGQRIFDGVLLEQINMAVSVYQGGVHECLRGIGGSAYLPSYMAVAEVAERPFIVSKAPVFQRLVCIISHNITAQKWPWFANLITHV